MGSGSRKRVDLGERGKGLVDLRRKGGQMVGCEGEDKSILLLNGVSVSGREMKRKKGVRKDYATSPSKSMGKESGLDWKDTRRRLGMRPLQGLQGELAVTLET